MDKGGNLEILAYNIVARLYLFGKTIDEIEAQLTPISPRCKLIATGEMLLFLLHHIDRLAYQKDTPSEMRTTMRTEIVANLIEKEIFHPKVTLKLMEDGIKPSLDAFGTSRSTAVKVLLPSFLKEVAEADTDYSSCTEFIGKSPHDEDGLINKLSGRILHRWEPEGNILWRFFIITSASDILLESELAKQDNEALNMLR